MLAIKPTLSEAERFDQMQQAINTGLPFLKRQPPNGYEMSIVGFGPSLHDTWRQISQVVMATSGAYDFLCERGVYPNYYVVLDPSQSTIGLLKNPTGGQFLMASCCHPDWWSKLEGWDVKLWHAIGNDYHTIEWIKRHHPAGLGSAIGGGSTVAQRAMNVAAWLGYRKFNVFGMDCSFTDSRHAGAHTGEIQPVTTVIFNDREFKTTPQLIQSAQEMEQFLLTVDADVTFYGDGLMQEIAKTIQKGKR